MAAEPHHDKVSKHNGGSAVSVQIPKRYMGVAQIKVREGIDEQKILSRDLLFILGSIGPAKVSADDLHKMEKSSGSCHEDDGDQVAFDDVTGASLDPTLVKEARNKEMEYFRKMQVYKKVPRSKCFAATGKGPIGVRWIDVNKQDNDNPLYRSRLVAKYYNNYKDPDLYTATPPLELLRMIISLAASNVNKWGHQWKIMVNDVSRA